MKKRKYLALLLAAGMIVQTALSTGGVVQVQAAEDTYVKTDELTDNDTAAPKKDKTIPSKNQYEYQKQELAAFCHFGPNTFNEIEWGEHYGDKTPNEIFKLTEDFDADTLVKTLKEAGFKKLIVTAKHHDGFCIWASEATQYDVSGANSLDGYTDVQSVSSYAVPALQWANAAGVVTGKSGSKLDPKGYATRAEVAAMLMRFCENVK